MFSFFDLPLIELLIYKHENIKLDNRKCRISCRYYIFDPSLISSAVAAKTIKFLFYKYNDDSYLLLPWFRADTAFLVYSGLFVGLMSFLSGVYIFGIIFFVFVILITKLWALQMVKDLRIELLEISIELAEKRLGIDKRWRCEAY